MDWSAGTFLCGVFILCVMCMGSVFHNYDIVFVSNIHSLSGSLVAGCSTELKQTSEGHETIKVNCKSLKGSVEENCSIVDNPLWGHNYEPPLTLHVTWAIGGMKVLMRAAVK